MTERPPQNPESPKHEPTEMVLSDFKRICQSEVGIIHTPEEKDQVIGVMHQTLERLDNKEMIHKYREGRIPTIHSLELAANEAIKHLQEEEPDEEIERITKLLEGQVRSIRGWTRRYVGTVVKFHLMKSAYYAQEEEADKFITADSERRRVHDALLSSIASFSKLLSDAQEITHYSPPIAWDLSSNLEEGTANAKPVVFSLQAIQNRDLIRDWAVATDCVEELQKSIAMMEAETKDETTTQEG